MKTRFIIPVLLILLINTKTYSQEIRYNILLTGASFASSQNTWFEMGCSELNAKPLNRALGGESIADTANRMLNGTLYSSEELDELDAFVIMQVHNRDVFENSAIKENIGDYIIPFNRSNYAAAYDYVIKKYISDCYNQKNDAMSKYYNSKSGKPAVIVLCTDWHDGRTIYNKSIRQLAAKWGFPLVEFDRYIGFSRSMPNPVTGEQQSVLYAKDTQIIDGVKYGWHPHRGKDKYIQQRMAAIFVDLMKKILPIR